MPKFQPMLRGVSGTWTEPQTFEDSTIFAHSIDITGATGLILENDETITNSTDGLISLSGNLAIPDGGTIGTATDTDSITIASAGAVTFSQGITSTAAANALGASSIADDVRLGIGTGFDTVLVNRSTSLSADTALSNVIVGTSDHQGVAANSLILSNITTDGDILVLVSDGGDSLEAININAASAILQLGHGMADVAIKTAGVEKVRFASAVTTFNRDSGNIGFVVNSDTLTAISVAGDTGVVTFGGNAFIGDSANANITKGLTLNQGAADDEILAFKSSDALHPLTNSAETDTYGKITKASGAGGGVMLWGLSDTGGDSCDFYALSGTTFSTAKTTSASAGYVFYTGIRNPGTANVTNPGSDQNLLAIWSGNDTARFIFDVEGSGHSDVEWTTYDREDDLALIDAIEGAMLGKRLTPERFGDNSLYYDRKYLESTKIIGEDSWHEEERDGRIQQRAMVNWQRLAMLHHGALLQVGDRLQEIEARAELAEQKLLALGAT